MTQLRRFPDGLPDALLALDDDTVLSELAIPTLVRVPGTGAQRARAIVTLLHGDESTGYHAVLRVLRRHRPYPFDLYVFLGNVPAALADLGFAHRFLSHQEDFNRVWGLDDPSTMMRRVADAVLDELRAADVESLVDLHNNTGENPFYAIVPALDDRTLNLATLFTTTLLKWDLAANTVMEAARSHRCTTIAVECGLPGRPESLAFAVDAIRRYLGAPPTGEGIERDHDLYGNLRRVLVKPEVTFRFAPSPGDHAPDLPDDVDLLVTASAGSLNFVEVPAGRVLGRCHAEASLPLRVEDAHGRDVTTTVLTNDGGRVVTTRPLVPVMMTSTVAAARKDVLFYAADILPPVD